MKRNTMRRIWALLLCMVLIFAMTGCGNTNNSSEITSEDSGPQLIEFGDDENASIETDGEDTGGDTDTSSKNNNKNPGTTSSGKNSGTSSGGKNSGTSSNKDDSSKTDNKNESTGTANTSKVETANKTDPFKNIPKRLVGSTVKFATWGDESGDTYMKVINAFTKKTGINVEVVEFSQGKYYSSITTQIANKNSPDVMIAANLPNSIKMLQPLQDIIDLSDSFWDQQVVDLGTIHGNSYVVNSLEGPWSGVMMVYYNKNIFENNGLKSPGDYYAEGNWTYETYLECAKEATALGYVGTSPDADTYNEQHGNPLITFDTKAEKVINNISKVSAGYKWMLNLIQNEKVSDGDRWFASLASDKMAMYTTDLYGCKYNGYFSNMKDSALAAVPLPSSANGKTLNRAVGDTRCYGIVKGAKNPEGAAYFLRYFLDYEYYEDADADIFKNDDLKKLYFEEIIPIYKNNKNRTFRISGEILDTNGQNMSVLFYDKVKVSTAAQVDTLVMAQKNVVDACVKSTNEFLNSLK